MSVAFSLNPDSQIAETEELSQESAILAPWQENPYQLVSWYDMEKFAAEKYAHIFSNIGGLSQVYGSLGNQIVSDEGCQTIIHKFSELADSCREIGLNVTANQVDAALDQLSRPHWSAIQISQLITDLGSAMVSEMKVHTFLWVPPEQAKYFRKEALHGEEVNAAFPSAVKDIAAAGTCYASDNWNASVFHSMRVLELGLNALARDLGVPYDRINWQNIIEGIESEIKAFKNLPRGDVKAQKEKLYSGAAVQFRYFKDAWRNHTMHVRENYDDHDAKSIMDHVGDFMRHLVSDLKLKE
jgi:hypothetical protein